MLCILFQSPTLFTLIDAQLCWWPYSLILRRCNRCESTLSGCWEPLPPVTLNPQGGPPVNSTTRPPDILLENLVISWCWRWLWVDQSKANRKSSTKVTREAKMLLLVQFWQTGETFYLPSKFLGRGKWCREYWEDSQKYIVFIFRLKAKIIREDLCYRTWGFYVGCCISLLGRESMNCQFKWNSSQIETDIIQSSPHSRCSWSSHVVTKDCPMLFPNMNL